MLMVSPDRTEKMEPRERTEPQERTVPPVRLDPRDLRARRESQESLETRVLRVKRGLLDNLVPLDFPEPLDSKVRNSEFSSCLKNVSKNVSKTCLFVVHTT